MIRTLFDNDNETDDPDPKEAYQCEAEQCIKTLGRERRIITSDDVQAVVKLPPSVHPNNLGGVFLRLSKEGVIRDVGVTQSRRPEGAGRLLRQWQLVDNAAPQSPLASNEMAVA